MRDLLVVISDHGDWKIADKHKPVQAVDADKPLGLGVEQEVPKVCLTPATLRCPRGQVVPTCHRMPCTGR